jgi:hypothetical protein
MMVVSGIIGSIVLLLTKRFKMKNYTSARIIPLSGFFSVRRIFDGGMDDGFEATLNINAPDAGEFSMTIPYQIVSQVQTVFQGNVAGWVSKNRIHF